MSKTNFSLDLLRRNEQNNPEKMIGAHVPIKKSPHTGTLLILMIFGQIHSLDFDCFCEIS